MKHNIAITTLALSIGLIGQATAADLVEGKDYRVVENPDKINGEAIIVREFFWYGCSHCYDLEPIMQKWKKTKPNDVAYFSTPAAVNPVWENSARGFYTAQLMGYENKTHDKLFKDIFSKAKMNHEIAGSNKKAVVNWYVEQGLDRDKFMSTMDSFAVNTKISRSKQGAVRYKVSGTPTVVVQGKYVITTPLNKIPEAIDFLIEKVRKEKSKS